MEASKLTLSDGVRKQKSAQTKMLLWFKNHPEALRDTNVTAICRAIALDKERPFKCTIYTIEQVFYKLMRKGLVFRQGNNKFRADFVINHGHPMMPPEIDEGVVKTTKIEKRSPKWIKSVLYQNKGKSIADLTYLWLVAYKDSDKLKATNIRNLANLIYEDRAFACSVESLNTIIGKMVRDGKIKKTRNAQISRLWDFAPVTEEEKEVAVVSPAPLPEPKEEPKEEPEEEPQIILTEAPVETKIERDGQGIRISLTLNINLNQ